MYLPRHVKLETRKQTKVLPVILLIIFITAVFFSIYKRKQIMLFFKGSSAEKHTKAENRLIESVLQGEKNKDYLQEYISNVQALLHTEPVNSRGYFAQARVHYLEALFSGFELKTIHLIEKLSRTGTVPDKILDDFSVHLEPMYRQALRARAFSAEFGDSNSNLILVLLYEALQNRKNFSLIAGELKTVQYERVSPELRKNYIWLSLLSSVKSADFDFLNQLLKMNKDLQGKSNLEITEREESYLQGLTFFYKKDFIRSLELIRKVQKEQDRLGIEAGKTEAEIFFLQNLHEKAIVILENLFEVSGKQDKDIQKRLQKIVESKSGLKSKYLK
ncbi:MAG TPA: hypothetical protein PK453_26575 [Leptospiraceae bacterium]|nr:hypothetical protein [Leptospiraceae bacterium]HNH06981.1 hypothetical protein [Leptospiraceae bacterium]HNI95426.1 hypothetical protein [Leptospiraceae bacterium]HNO22330.1 hypothetical protein [Leptospiraceae bacterium]